MWLKVNKEWLYILLQIDIMFDLKKIVGNKGRKWIYVDSLVKKD